MPEQPMPKVRPHPWKGNTASKVRSDGVDERLSQKILQGLHADSQSQLSGDYAQVQYADVCAISNFTFLRGASHPEELIAQAKARGYRAAAVVDVQTFGGLVRAHVASKEAGIGLMVGCQVCAVYERSDGCEVRQDDGAGMNHDAQLRGLQNEDDLYLSVCQSVERGLRLVLLCADVRAYGVLCQLLTDSKRRSGERRCEELGIGEQIVSDQTRWENSWGKSLGVISVHDVAKLLSSPDGAGLHCVVMLPEKMNVDDRYMAALAGLSRACGAEQCFDRHNVRISLGVGLSGSGMYGSLDSLRWQMCKHVSQASGLARVVACDAVYHDISRRMLSDVLACIRNRTHVDQAGLSLGSGDDRSLMPIEEIVRIVRAFEGCGWEKIFERSMEIARACSGFSMDQLKYQYPKEVVPENVRAIDHLRKLTYEGMAQRYPQRGQTSGNTDTKVSTDNTNYTKVVEQVEHELQLIEELGYAHYFLTVHDIVRFARSRNILCQGRGAAANSSVCFCLGVTAVDPARVSMLFERFVSKERNEPPDIDIDFEHDRREEVIQYLYEKYGRLRAALTSEIITYRGRSAVRDVGKALGLSIDLVEKIAKGIDWFSKSFFATEEAEEKTSVKTKGQHEKYGVFQRLCEIGVDAREPRIELLIELCGQILGFPRHRSQHVGGFVITDGLLSRLVPIEPATMNDRTVIEWDKDDIEAMGMMKVDVLGLGMLSAVRRCMQLCQSDVGDDGQACPSKIDLADVPVEDGSRVDGVYDMMCRADTVGVFQIESRAQMSMLPRLKPRSYYDLVIQVAIVRPGPIVGDMVHPYLRRRDGLEGVEYPDQRVREILGRTLGVPLFQEQAMSLAMHCAGFTAGQADALRRAIAAWKTKQKVIYQFGQKIISGMVERGYSQEFAQRCFEQIKGFSEYGFPESHAASFAHIVYASAWLKRWYPAEFCAAIINSQPMGFYAPAQLVRDAQNHGVVVRGVDVCASRWMCTIEQRDSAEHDKADLGAGVNAGVNVGNEPAGWRAPGRVVRLGLRMIRGIGQEAGLAIERAMRASADGSGPRITTLTGLWRSSGVSVRVMRALAEAGALAGLHASNRASGGSGDGPGLDRQRALWEIERLTDERLPLFDHFVGGGESGRDDVEQRKDRAISQKHDERDDGLLWTGKVGPQEEVLRDYRATGLSLANHPVAFARHKLATRGVRRCEELGQSQWVAHGQRVAVAGIVLVRQRPHTAGGIIFMTIEDETGSANVIVKPKVFQRDRAAARHGVLLVVRGVVQRAKGVTHILAGQISCADQLLGPYAQMSRDFH